MFVRSPCKLIAIFVSLRYSDFCFSVTLTIPMLNS